MSSIVRSVDCTGGSDNMPTSWRECIKLSDQLLVVESLDCDDCGRKPEMADHGSVTVDKALEAEKNRGE